MERHPYGEQYGYGYGSYDQYQQQQPPYGYPPQQQQQPPPPDQYGYPPQQAPYGGPPPNPNMALMQMPQPQHPPNAYSQMPNPYQYPPNFFPPVGPQSPMMAMPYFPYSMLPQPTSTPPVQTSSEPSAAELELERIRSSEARRKADRLAALEEDRARMIREAAEAEARRREREDADRARQDAIRDAIEDYKKKLEEEARVKAEFDRAVAEAEKNATEEGSKKLREAEEEHKAKLDEATAATEAMNQVVMNLSLEMEKLQPPPEKEQRVLLIDHRQEKKREFRLPFSLAKEWKNFENLLMQAFEKESVYGISLGTLIDEGKYDLVDKQGMTIMRQYWNDVVEPGWEVKINLWPIAVPAKEKPRERESSSRKGKTRKKRESLYFMEVPGEAPPPPPNHGSPPEGSAEVVFVDDDDYTVSSGSAANVKKKRVKAPTFWEVVRGKPKKK